MTKVNDISIEEWDSLGYKGPSFPDMVNSPPHYNQGSKETIEVIRDSMSHLEFAGYLQGNVMKYLCRYGHKGKPEEDLKKAQWYLSKLIENEGLRE
jgi:hypothetical protein